MNSIETPRELLDFMSNIHYGYLGKNGRVYHEDDLDFSSDWSREYLLQNKEDLLKTRYGNCWDQVELERDWFIHNGYEIRTYYEMVLLDYDNPYPTHTFLVFKDENHKWNWFENAISNHRGIFTFDSLEELIESEYQYYLSLVDNYAITQEEKLRVVIMEYDKPLEHCSSEEYIDHCLHSKIIRSENDE